MTIIQLLDEKTLKDIKYIRNTNSPQGCFVELNKSPDGKIISFITHYSSGKTVSESSDFKSSYLSNQSNFWVDYTKEGIIKCKPAAQAPTLAEKVSKFKTWLGNDIAKYDAVKKYMAGSNIVLTSVDGWMDKQEDKSASGVSKFIDLLLTDIYTSS